MSMYLFRVLPYYLRYNRSMDINKKLSEHFTLLEFTMGGTAMPKESSIYFTDKVISDNIIKLKYLATRMEQVRELLGNKPLNIHCGLRPYDWEIARKRSGTSQHTRGEAIDFSCPSFGAPIEVARFISKKKSIIKYDQLIQEFGWVHLSFTSKTPRMQDLTLNVKTGGYSPGV